MLKNNKNYQQRGFSFVELLVVVVIMVLLFSLGYANYRDFSRRKVLEQIASNIKSDLRLAQGSAIAGKKDCDDPTDSLSAYSFEVDSLNRSYFISSVCTDSLGDTKKEIKRVNISMDDFSLNVVPTSEVRFKVLGQGTDLQGSNFVVTVSYNWINIVSESVIVTPGGQIYSETVYGVIPTSSPAPSSTPVPPTATPTPDPSSEPPPTNTPVPPTVTPSVWCQDSDNGQDIYVYGSVTGTGPNCNLTPVYDICLSGNTIVGEYYCDAATSRCRGIQIACPAGYSCSGGRCVSL